MGVVILEMEIVMADKVENSEPRCPVTGQPYRSARDAFESECG